MSNRIIKIVKFLVEQEVEKYQTKKNNSLNFKFYEQSPHKKDQSDRGWVVHQIEAFIGTKNVGYIKISYIPKENFPQHFNDVVDFVTKIKGTGGRYDGLYKDLSDDKKLKLLDHIGLSWTWPGPLYGINIDELSEKEKKTLINDLHNKVKKYYGSEYRKFIKFHVDKPLVDYIRVENEYRRQRIGIILYEVAAKWLAKKGLKLYASGNQSAAAKAAWVWLAQNKGANIGSEKGPYGKKRIFLSYLS